MPQNVAYVTSTRAASFYGVAIGSLPVVTGATASILTTAAKGDAAGTLSATNTPTSWKIVNGDDNGFFTIDSNGAVTVNVDSGLVVGEYILNISARNATGAGNAIDIIYISSASVKEPATKLAVLKGVAPTAAVAAA